MSLNVKNAFVNATISKELYITQPDGFLKQGMEDHVLLLQKSFYVLKKESRE